jgi:hypothetical protein
MNEREHIAPFIEPALSATTKSKTRRLLRDRLDAMLRGCWADLVARSEPLAGEMLERATGKFAMQETAETIP